MQRTFFRLPPIFTSQCGCRMTSIVPTFLIRCRSSSAASPPQIKGIELQRAATPINGCDYKHWLVVMDPPIGYPLRHQIVEGYIQTLASALGSEEEAKRSIYSVSTKYYYAFGCTSNENVVHSIKSMPNVRWVLPDSHHRLDNNDYGGESFVDGSVVPYDEMFHEEWLQDQSDRRRRRSRRKQQNVDSD